jgi:hypothetical protein
VKFDQRTRGEILGAIRIGVSYERAATSAGVAVRTLRPWLRQGEADETVRKNTAHARFVREFPKAESGFRLGRVGAPGASCSTVGPALTVLEAAC